MPVRVRALLPAQLVKGVYLTDGERLYRILEVLDRDVELEDCSSPEGMPQWMPVKEVLKRLKLVRPS